MEALTPKSRISALFSVEWQSDGGVRHKDCLWSDQVNLWRDCFSQELLCKMLESGAEEIATIDLAATSFHAPWRSDRVVAVRRQQFQPPAGHENLLPEPGRFYPQGFIHGVSGVFAVSTAPARCLAVGTEGYRFDLNHPLAGRELRFGVEVQDVHDVATERGGRCEDWLERVCQDGPGMQAHHLDLQAGYFTEAALQRSDSRADQLFYERPRLIQHLDATALATISHQYAALIPAGARVLDLMGSWDSHLPNSLAFSSLAVLGMNQEELFRNSQATDRLLHDLNREPSLPFVDNSFDVVICTASIEYLAHPLEVLGELHRVLVPGGVLAISFSNRWFPPKTIHIWTGLHPFERLAMVMEMLCRTPGFGQIHTLSRQGEPRPEGDAHPELACSDPVFMVWGRKLPR